MPTYSQLAISNGVAGTRDTLRLMSRITKDYKKSPIIRELAMRIVRRLPNHAFKQEARKIFHFVKRNIRYVKDVRGVETLQSPIQTLRLRAGDCDDMSIIFASLLESIGHPTRFVAVGFYTDDAPFSHVLVQTRVGQKWVWCELTRPMRFGKAPPNIAKTMLEHN